MKISKKIIAVLLSAFMIVVCMQPMGVSAKEDDNWVGAWSTSPVEFNLKKILNLNCIENEYGLHNLTFRTRLQPTIEGKKIRITLSNVYGTGDMVVDAVTVAKGSEKYGQTMSLKTKKTVTFDGSKKAVIPQGKTLTSDPIDLSVNALEYVTITTYMKNTDHLKTFGLIGGNTYIGSGNQTNLPTTVGVPMKLKGDFGEYSVIPLISQLEVYNPHSSATVLIGDSTLANDIPILLAKRLNEQGINNVGILQQAIKGNRLLADGAGALGMAYGEAMMKRFERDALNLSGVKNIIIKVGDNDIIHPNCKSMQGKALKVTTEEMIAGYKELIDVAHQKGIKVYLMTRTAWKGYTRNILNTGDDIQWSEELDSMRKDINNWIKSSDNLADGYIDLDYLCKDEGFTELKDELTTDGVHFTSAGQQAVVDGIPLNIFR